MKTHYVVALVVAIWCSRSVQGQDLTPEQIQQLQELFDQTVGGQSSTQKPPTPPGGGQIPGPGGQLPGQGGQFPGQGGQFPGQGGQFPGQGGQFPGQGGQFPGQGGFFPGVGGQFPGQGGVFPGAGGQFPGQGGFFPGAGGQFPGQGGFFPGQGGFPNRPNKPGRPHRPGGGGFPGAAPVTQGGGCKFFCKAPSGQYVCCPNQQRSVNVHQSGTSVGPDHRSRLNHQYDSGSETGRGCFNCSETYHRVEQCKFNQQLVCSSCGHLGHKSKMCRY